MNSLHIKKQEIDGRLLRQACTNIDGHSYTINLGILKVARLEDEWFYDVSDPSHAIKCLSSLKLKPDLFSFWQRLPNLEQQYDYFMDPEPIAAIPIKSYDFWWNKQIRYNARGKVRKAQKLGIVVREANFDDAFLQGMHDIFNESAVRQGRRFWHYGKDIATIRKQFSRYLFRETIIGAYYNEKLIGFAFIAHADNYAMLGQIISKIKDRDKAPNNALIAKAVEVCEARNIPYLVYANWPSPGTLADFKKQNGFEKIEIPRYYIPLTWKGRLAINYGAHKGWKNMLPDDLKLRLKHLRRQIYNSH